MTKIKKSLPSQERMKKDLKQGMNPPSMMGNDDANKGSIQSEEKLPDQHTH